MIWVEDDFTPFAQTHFYTTSTTLKYLCLVILLLPVTTLLLLWDHLPTQLSLHASGHGPDRLASRDDFGGLVVAVTAMFALVSYLVLDVASSFQPISEAERHKAYLAIAAGSSLMGFAILITGILSAR